MVASILKTVPALAARAPDAPRSCGDREQTLEKEREDRYQGQGLAGRPRRLKKRHDFEDELENSVPPMTVNSAALNDGGKPSVAESKTPRTNR